MGVVNRACYSDYSSIRVVQKACPATPDDAVEGKERVISFNKEDGKLIAAVGISVVDVMLVMDGFRTGEGSFHCERLYTEGGGMVATALCAAARLGSETRLFSRIGDDIHGRFILDSLARFGVDVSGIANVRGRNTTVSVVLVDRATGEKQFYSEFVKSAYIDPLDMVLSLLEGAEALLVDGHWTDQAFRAAGWARERGIPVVSDFKRMYTGLEKVFPLVDYHVLPRFFAAEVTGKKTPESILRALARKYGGTPVITGGSEGGMYLLDGTVRRYRAFPVECVDSTGAGDAFHGAFCHFLTRGADIQRCLELASAVGALNCRALGGRAALPSPEELSSFLEENGADPELP